MAGSQTARMNGGKTDAVDRVVVAGNEAIIVIRVRCCDDAGIGALRYDVGVQSVDGEDGGRSIRMGRRLLGEQDRILRRCDGDRLMVPAIGRKGELRGGGQCGCEEREGGTTSPPAILPRAVRPANFKVVRNISIFLSFAGLMVC
ncbi:hypothetical protein [Rhizobium leguminosarum]|uniref:hypothetical protein n=1 Tax=Rhizobium leguminosarum TaxID=384 RepID=UPI0011D08DB0|nr:hypothetical protein [Rhizobium leguminosarum]